MSNETEEKVGELLVREDVISPSELREAKQLSSKQGSRVGHELTRLGYVDEGELTNVLSKHHGVPSVNLEDVDIPGDLIEIIPRDVARRHHCIPVNRSGSTLVVAMADPSNIYAVDDLKFLTDYDIEVVVASESAIEEKIDEHYEKEEGQLGSKYDEIVEGLDAEEFAQPDEEETREVLDIDELEDQADSEPVVRLVNLILARAIKREASDIHIEPYEKDLRVRFRIDGVLEEVMHPPKRLEAALISRIKVMADLDISEKRLPQDGRIQARMGGGREMDFRVSICPTMNGEKAVLRLLDKSGLQLDMAKLGFEEESLATFRTAIHQPYGMCLVTGPTGSGKTTTLYSALSELNTPKENISTAEDPVEYGLEGINQVQMKEGIGLDFASALRSFLRQDPDIIMVGEIRDYETGDIAIKAALTGHLVMSTLHTNSAAGTIRRMVNMGIEPFMITSALNVIIAQRLARKICDNCKEEVDITNDALVDMGVPEDELDQPIFRGKGCQHCDNRGYSGQIGLFEVLECTEDIKDAVVRGAPTAEIKKIAVEEGMNTLRQAGINKMLEGVTTAEEVVRNTTPDAV
jgi:type IV pilus assembly protein PilB